jgi:hypothetical protein
LPNFKTIQFQASRYAAKAKAFVREATASRVAATAFALILLGSILLAAFGHVFTGLVAFAFLVALMAGIRTRRNAEKTEKYLSERLKWSRQATDDASMRALDRKATISRLQYNLDVVRADKRRDADDYEARLEAPEKLWKERMAQQTASHKADKEKTKATIEGLRKELERVNRHDVPVSVYGMDFTHGDTEWATLEDVPNNVPFHGHHVEGSNGERNITAGTLYKDSDGQLFMLRSDRTLSTPLSVTDLVYADRYPFRTDFYHLNVANSIPLDTDPLRKAKLS